MITGSSPTTRTWCISSRPAIAQLTRPKHRRFALDLEFGAALQDQEDLGAQVVAVARGHVARLEPQEARPDFGRDDDVLDIAAIVEDLQAAWLSGSFQVRQHDIAHQRHVLHGLAAGRERLLALRDARREVLELQLERVGLP